MSQVPSVVPPARDARPMGESLGEPPSDRADLGSELAAIAARLRHLYAELDVLGVTALHLPTAAPAPSSADRSSGTGRRFS